MEVLYIGVAVTAEAVHVYGTEGSCWIYLINTAHCVKYIKRTENIKDYFFLIKPNFKCIKDIGPYI